MIEVISFRVLVRPDKLEEKDEAYAAAKRMGLDIVGTQKSREQQAVDKGTVVSYGPTAFKDYGLENPLREGDSIVYAKHAGKLVTDPETDEEFLVINDEDVVCILKNGA